MHSSLTDELTEGIRLLNSIAIKLRNKRMAAGALNLASPEVKIHLETTESTEPIDVEQKQLLETNSLVEEFMLLANITVAKRIYEQFPATAVLRCVALGHAVRIAIYARTDDMLHRLRPTSTCSRTCCRSARASRSTSRPRAP